MANEDKHIAPIAGLCGVCKKEVSRGFSFFGLYTSECSHTFHFPCIHNNVKNGHLECPVCRVPWSPKALQLMQLIPAQPPLFQQHQPPQPTLPLFQPGRFEFAPADDRFHDDESVDQHATADSGASGGLEIRTDTEYPAIERGESRESLTVLIHLRAPSTPLLEPGSVGADQGRAPLDLVAVLDVSGSMDRTKLYLLKRAMEFVVDCLAPKDRLSIVSFSNTAIRVLPLRCMNASGKLHAGWVLGALSSIGNTNIADGLSMGARVMDGRRKRNPVSGILFLSDGQDNCSFLRYGPENISLLPPSIRGVGAGRVPVHAFGFGLDHDAALMSSLAEASGGTFSFVEAEADIGEAFAQCLGGLMSVTVQDLRVSVQCVDPGVRIVGPIRSGGYTSQVRDDDRLAGSIDVGDMYAGESRDFLLCVNVPRTDDDGATTTTLLRVATMHTEPVSKAKVESEAREVQLVRPVVLSDEDRLPCFEVERQRKRYEALERMSAAREAAERGHYGQAVSTLENCREVLFGGSTSGDDMIQALDAEMREMKERMGNRETYLRFGRAYALAGLSSHLQQRATARSYKQTSEMMFGSAAFGKAEENTSRPTPFGGAVQAGAPQIMFGAAPQMMFGSAGGRNTVSTFQSSVFGSATKAGAPPVMFGSTGGSDTAFTFQSSPFGSTTQAGALQVMSGSAGRSNPVSTFQSSPFGSTTQAGAPQLMFGSTGGCETVSTFQSSLFGAGDPQVTFGSVGGINTVATTFQSSPFGSAAQAGAPQLMFGSKAGQASGWGSSPPMPFGATLNTTTRGLFGAAPLQAAAEQTGIGNIALASAAGTPDSMGPTPQVVLGSYTATTTGSGIVGSPYLTPAMERLMKLARTGQSPQGPA